MKLLKKNILNEYILITKNKFLPKKYKFLIINSEAQFLYFTTDNNKGLSYLIYVSYFKKFRSVSSSGPTSNYQYTLGTGI